MPYFLMYNRVFMIRYSVEEPSSHPLHVDRERSVRENESAAGCRFDISIDLVAILRGVRCAGSRLIARDGQIWAKYLIWPKVRTGQRIG
jgi:hypothetical protein